MSDKLPGSSWSNPIWHGKWRIYVSCNVEIHGYQYQYVHDDFDGAPDSNDNRCGCGKSIPDCIEEIESLHEGSIDS